MQKNRRDDILTEAFNLLLEEGLPMLSYDLIAKRSGVSRQLIRYYFASKEDFMIALCDMLAMTYREALVSVARTIDTADRLDQLFDFYFDLLDGAKKPRDDQVYDAVMSLAAGSKPIRDNLRNQYSLLGSVVSHEITLQHPEISHEDANQISFLFVSLMYGHWKMVASLGISEDHKRITRKAIDRLIESYLQTPSKPEEYLEVWKVE